MPNGIINKQWLQSLAKGPNKRQVIKMTSQVQYHFHNVSFRDLLVKYMVQWQNWKEMSKNLFLYLFDLSEFVLQESTFWYKFITFVNPC